MLPSGDLSVALNVDRISLADLTRYPAGIGAIRSAICFRDSGLDDCSIFETVLPRKTIAAMPATMQRPKIDPHKMRTKRSSRLIRDRRSSTHRLGRRELRRGSRMSRELRFV